MWSVNAVLIFFGLVVKSVISVDNDWLKLFKAHILERVEPYQIVIFINNTENADFFHQNSSITDSTNNTEHAAIVYQNSIITEISTAIPCHVLDAERFPPSDNNRLLQSLTFENATQSTTCQNPQWNQCK